METDSPSRVTVSRHRAVAVSRVAGLLPGSPTGAQWAWTGVLGGGPACWAATRLGGRETKLVYLKLGAILNTAQSSLYPTQHAHIQTHTHTLRVAQWAHHVALALWLNGPPCKWSGVEWSPSCHPTNSVKALKAPVSHFPFPQLTKMCKQISNRKSTSIFHALHLRHNHICYTQYTYFVSLLVQCNIGIKLHPKQKCFDGSCIQSRSAYPCRTKILSK